MFLTSAAINEKIVTPACRPASTHTSINPEQASRIQNNNDSSLMWTHLGVVGEKDSCDEDKEKIKLVTADILQFMLWLRIFYMDNNQVNVNWNHKWNTDSELNN